MAEKRELQMKEITEQLEQGVKELFTSVDCQVKLTHFYV